MARQYTRKAVGVSKSKGRPVSIKLTGDNIDKLVNYCEGVKYGFHAATAEREANELKDRLVINFRRIILNSMDPKGYPYSTRHLMESCKAKITDFSKGHYFKIKVYNNCNYFKFFEYGTGMMGAEGPSDDSIPDDWEYGEGQMEDGGWLFPARGIDGKKTMFKTYGQPAHLTISQLREMMEAEYPSELLSKIKIKPPIL